MKIPYVNIANQNNKISKQLTSIFKNILDTGEYVGGKEIQNLKEILQNIVTQKYNKNRAHVNFAWSVCGEEGMR